jgi:hypothetical protein
LPSLVLRLEREVNVACVSTHVIGGRSDRLKLEPSLRVCLHPALQPPSRHRAILRSEIEAVAISVVCMNNNSARRSATIRLDDESFDDQRRARFARCRDASSGKHLLWSGFLRFIPAPQPEGVDLSNALGAAERNQQTEKAASIPISRCHWNSLLSFAFGQRLVFAIHRFKGSTHCGKGWKNTAWPFPVEIAISSKEVSLLRLAISSHDRTESLVS